MAAKKPDLKKLDQETARKRLFSMPAEQRAEVLRLCGDWRHTVQHVFINDMPAAQYGKRFKCHAPAMIELALDRLGRIIG